MEVIFSASNFFTFIGFYIGPVVSLGWITISYTLEGVRCGVYFSAHETSRIVFISSKLKKMYPHSNSGRCEISVCKGIDLEGRVRGWRTDSPLADRQTVTERASVSLLHSGYETFLGGGRLLLEKPLHILKVSQFQKCGFCPNPILSKVYAIDIWHPCTFNTKI